MCHKDFKVWVSWKRLYMYIRDRYKKGGGGGKEKKEVPILWSALQLNPHWIWL